MPSLSSLKNFAFRATAAKISLSAKAGVFLTEYGFLSAKSSSLHRVILLIVISAVVVCSFPKFKTGQLHIAPDSGTYLRFSYATPWQIGRSPGYPLFLDLVSFVSTGHSIDAELVSKDMPEMHRTQSIMDADLRRAATLVVVLQYLLMVSGVVAFGYSLTYFFPAAFIIPGLYLSVRLCQPPAASGILTEPLSFSLTAFFCACAVKYIASREIKYLGLMAALAVAGFLVRPGLIFLPVLACLFVLYAICQSMRSRRRLLASLAVLCFLILGTMSFPAFLYHTGGIWTVGQLSSMAKAMFALYLAEPADVDKIDHDSAKLLAHFFEIKPEVDSMCDQYFSNGRENYSSVYTYLHTANAYGWVALGKAMKAEFPDRVHNQILTYKTIMNMAQQVLALHKRQYYELMAGSFISGLGLVYDDYNPTTYRGLSKRQLKLFYLSLSLTFILALVLLKRETVMLIMLPCCVHILDLAAMSVGHAVLNRYLTITEWLMPMSLCLALLAVGMALKSKIKTMPVPSKLNKFLRWSHGKDE